MPLKTAPLEEPTINLTSMLDVVLMLIVFFMLSTKFSEEERQTDIKVPKVTETAALSGQPDEIVVNVSVDGAIQVRGKRHDPKSLKQLLLAAQTGFANQAVVIRGDSRCEFQRVMDVLSTCKEAGVRNVSMAHVPKE